MPDTAPDAPTSGLWDEGADKVCAPAAHHAAKKIEQQKPEMAKGIFHIIGENPDKSHVGLEYESNLRARTYR